MNINYLSFLLTDCRITCMNDHNEYSIDVTADDRNREAFVASVIETLRQFDSIDHAVIRTCIDELAGVKKKKSKKIIIKRYGTNEGIKPKTDAQADYVAAIQNNLITFATGPAGTGKSFLAIAVACKLLKDKDVERIVLSRPVVEAGENLGFLPGDLKDKIDPYMRPLYDALYTILGKTMVDTYIDKGIIEIAPLAYMRGRTLSNSFVLLDEAQNATYNQLKMFLTRFGEHSKMVVNCDPSQIDLPKKSLSCIDSIPIFDGIADIKLCSLTNDDVIRHPIVCDIIKAYQRKEDTYEN